MELFAKISLLAKTLGNVNNISEADVRKIMEMRPNWIKEDDGYAGCRIGDKFISGTDKMAAAAGNNGNGNTDTGEDEMITLRKSELVDMVSKIVANIVNKR